jgi:hypothetical protein
MKKVVVLVLSFGLIGSAMGQIVYPTNVFWQFLEGLQAGDSSTLNYLEYKNGFLLLETNQRSEKILQARNELNDIGITTIFIDNNGNGGISVDSSNGNTVVKLRGALYDHSYINNEFVSIGRGGQSQDYGGTIDGARFTVSSTTREPDYGLWDANNYQMMLQSSKDSLGGYAGLAFTSESAAQDRNVGAFINYRKTGNDGRGELHFGTKTSTTSLADGVHAMKIYDGSVTIDSTIVLPNLYTGTSDTVLIIDNDVVQKKVLPVLESGTYTPTLSNATVNISASTPYQAQWMRVGNVVTVSGSMDLTYTATGQKAEINISLPIASNFTTSKECQGAADFLVVSSNARPAVVVGDATNDAALFSTTTSDIGIVFPYSYTYTYEIK